MRQRKYLVGFWALLIGAGASFFIDTPEGALLGLVFLVMAFICLDKANR